MNVNRNGFEGRLLEVLEAISAAHFVSIDLELTGIPPKPPGGSQKQSLQQRYLQVKAAADKFQVLQVGLTCAEEDTTSETYILRSYNFNISPHPTEDVDISRVFSCDSDALNFLVSSGFDITEPFRSGVPYLSFEEEELAKQRFRERLKRTYGNVELDHDDTDSLQFLNTVREEITAWENGPQGEYDQLVIVSRSKTSDDTGVGNLSAFDKRLVHQLVRNEFPSLRTFGREKCIAIKRKDNAREAADLEKKKAASKEKINRQVGFRTIVDAITGKSLDYFDVFRFARDPLTGDSKAFNRAALATRFNCVKDLLRTRRLVLVGHNMFLDLVFFYRTFIGPLPELVTDFATLTHSLFPLVVDTKYMATHKCDHINPTSSLYEIEGSLRSQKVPNVLMHKSFPRYVNQEAFHEAGFDSYLTSRVMVLLSAELEASGTYIPEPPSDSETDSYHTAREPPSDTAGDELDEKLGENLADSPIDKAAETADRTAASKATMKSRLKKNTAEKTSTARKRTANDEKSPPGTKSRFAHSNAFSLLAIGDQNTKGASDGAEAETDSTPSQRASSDGERSDGTSSSQPALGNGKFSLNPNAAPFVASRPSSADGRPSSSPLNNMINSEPKSRRATTRRHGEQGELRSLMPPFDCDFWRVYGNKLRIFGTFETFLDLDPHGHGFKREREESPFDYQKVKW